MAAMRQQNTFPLRKVRTGPGAAAAATAAVDSRIRKSLSADQAGGVALPPGGLGQQGGPGRRKEADGLSSRRGSSHVEFDPTNTVKLPSLGRGPSVKKGS